MMPKCKCKCLFLDYMHETADVTNELAAILISGHSTGTHSALVLPLHLLQLKLRGPGDLQLTGLY